jgi:hypothetical protein
MFFFRFVHFDQVVSEAFCENIADLAVAADYFGVDTLKPYCDQLISENITVEDIWTVLNIALKASNNLESIAESCKQVI